KTCIPKDPAALWNAEFVQAEELFSQDAIAENCLRDNRFCAVANPFVRRSEERELFDLAAPKLNGARVSGPSNTVRQKVNPPQPRKIEQTSQKKLDQQTICKQKKVTDLPASKKLGQNSKNSSTAGGSLANLVSSNCAHEAAELNSNDEGQDVNVKRTSKTEGGRKRRVSILASKESAKELVSEKKCKEDKMEVDEVKVREEEHHQPPKEDGQNHGSSTNVNNKVINPASTSPKRLKVLKTRIDEHGREAGLKKANCTSVGKPNDDRAADTTS
ncbi:hypothetical protein ACJRO7_023286, partial [Eucalyptus globulus]